jgi:hypothetical protein
VPIGGSDDTKGKPPGEAVKLAAVESKEPKPEPPALAKPVEPPLPEGVTRQELAQDMLSELKRLGCYTGTVNHSWSSRSQRALERFNRLSALELPVEEPQSASLDALKGWKGPPCPSEKIVGPRRQAPRAPVPSVSAPRKELKAYAPPRKELRTAPKRHPAQALRTRPPAAPSRDGGSDEIRELQRAFPSAAWPGH